MSVPRQRLALALLLACLLTPAASWAQLVNGSFEPAVPFSGNLILGGGSTAIPGWTTTDTGVEWFTPGTYGFGAAPSGIAVVDELRLLRRRHPADLPHRAGTRVRLRLESRRRRVRAATEPVRSWSAPTARRRSSRSSTTRARWCREDRTFLFTADDASATLSFRCLQNANLHFAIIDGVGPNATTPTRSSTWGRIKDLYSR